MSLLLLALLACNPGKTTDTADTAPTPDPGPWPDWAWQHWVWEDESTQESATALVDDYLARDIPVGAIIIDSPWETGYNTFEFDTDLFPDAQAMVDGFHSKGVRVFLWITGCINTDVPDLYEEAASKGYFMQNGPDEGPATIHWWKGEGSLIDFFNPEAVAWWQGLMDKSLALGIDGWKVDGVDYYAAVSSRWSPGLGAEVTRLEYSYAYYQAFHDYTRTALGDDRVLTSRPVDTYGLAPEDPMAAAFTPPDIAWASWVGDQDPTFLGLEAALLNMRLSSEAGYLAFGSDIGGYREDGTDLGRTREVFLRWAGMGTFCPVMENGGGGEHRPWMFDEEASDIYRSFVQIHHALLPYLRQQGDRAWSGGRSLMTFTSDTRYTWMLGDDLFVAPFLEEGTSLTVRFPDGDRWVWIFDPSQVFEGGTEETLDIPLDSYGAFAREGSEVASLFSSSR